MLRSTFALSLFALVIGCGSSDTTAPVENGVATISLDREYMRATIASGWVNLRTLELNGESETPEAEDVYVRGLVTGWVFAADGEISGPIKSAPEEAAAEEVWLRLRDRSVHPRTAGEPAPEGGAIAGIFDRDTELFYPRDRVIHSSPRATPAPLTENEAVAPTTP